MTEDAQLKLANNPIRYTERFFALRSAHRADISHVLHLKAWSTGTSRYAAFHLIENGDCSPIGKYVECPTNTIPKELTREVSS